MADDKIAMRRWAIQDSGMMMMIQKKHVLFKGLNERMAGSPAFRRCGRKRSGVQSLLLVAYLGRFKPYFRAKEPRDCGSGVCGSDRGRKKGGEHDTEQQITDKSLPNYLCSKKRSVKIVTISGYTIACCLASSSQPLDQSSICSCCACIIRWLNVNDQFV